MTLSSQAGENTRCSDGLHSPTAPTESNTKHPAAVLPQFQRDRVTELISVTVHFNFFDECGVSCWLPAAGGGARRVKNIQMITGSHKLHCEWLKNLTQLSVKANCTSMLCILEGWRCKFCTACRPKAAQYDAKNHFMQ